MARLADLRELRDGLLSRLDGCESDQNYAVLGRLLIDVTKQIEEIAPAEQERMTPLDELRQRRAGRSGPAAAGGSAKVSH